jgi:hypothetical protein
MGITDREAQLLFEAAASCEDEIHSVDKHAGTLIFESRLRVANEEQTSDELAGPLREPDARRFGIILTHVQRLKNSLQPLRFKVIEEYIRSRENTGTFFPAAHPKKL